MTPAVRDYLLVTASYWGFTLVDGALRMVVLLHFFQLGYSPFSIGAYRCQALSDFSIDPVLMSSAGSALLFGIGTEALP
jgi:hypothetical protein